MIKFFKKLFGIKVTPIVTQTPPNVMYFKHENIVNLSEKDYVSLKSECGYFNYGCYRIGDNVSVNKAGSRMGNAGSHGVYQYTISSKTFIKTHYSYADELVKILLSGSKYHV